MRSLITIVLALLVAASHVEAFGPMGMGMGAQTMHQKGVHQMIACTTCNRIAKYLGKYISKTIMAETPWSRVVRDGVKEEIARACLDEELFPKQGTNFIQSCHEFANTRMSAAVKVVRELIVNEEDIVPEDFCKEIGLCKKKADSLDASMGIGTAKQQYDEDRKELL